MGSVSDKNQLFSRDILEYHLNLLNSEAHNQQTEEAYLAPILSSRAVRRGGEAIEREEYPEISQIGLLAGISQTLDLPGQTIENQSRKEDPRLLFNVSSPSSTFICGSQGSGKSHTLSCMLENCLIRSKVGRLPNPLTGVVFHYDAFISDTVGSPCEAAFLSSHPDVDVRVLCSPTNIRTIQGTYSRFNIRVNPLQIDQSDLNTKRMLDLMAVGQSDGPMPLYMHTIKRILREMRIQQQATDGGFDYPEFRQRVFDAGLTPAQLEPLKQRLETLESFMPPDQVIVPHKKNRIKLKEGGSSWEPAPGCLTIVDLSCPCISSETACSLFNICLGIFLEKSPEIGRVVALDEAHKYMNSSVEASAFTETLVSVVRLQRHLAARVIISTQEPTISTTLLNLCSVTIVHRFTSPEWLRILKTHIAGASDSSFHLKKIITAYSERQGQENGETESDSASLFSRIVHLRVGEALLFCPSAIIEASVEDGHVNYYRLGANHLGVRIRSRLTLDGGRSVISH